MIPMRHALTPRKVFPAGGLDGHVLAILVLSEMALLASTSRPEK